MSLAQKLRDMHDMAADACDPEYNKVLIQAALELVRLEKKIEQQAKEIEQLKAFLDRLAGSSRRRRLPLTGYDD